MIASRAIVGAAAITVVLVSGLSAAKADTPYNKTFVGQANVCIAQTGQCTGVVPVHVFLAKSGRLYSFLQSQGGQMFRLGEYIAVGSLQERFIVSGDTLVFEAVANQGGSRLVLRGYLQDRGGQCYVNGGATLNGAPVQTNTQASCEVYEGQH